MNKLFLLALCSMISLSISALAQRPPMIVSPEVQPDGHVTFRFAGPNALKVEVELEGEKTPMPMQKQKNLRRKMKRGMQVWRQRCRD